jgi:hypothetical protein
MEFGNLITNMEKVIGLKKNIKKNWKDMKK